MPWTKVEIRAVSCFNGDLDRDLRSTKFGVRVAASHTKRLKLKAEP